MIYCSKFERRCASYFKFLLGILRSYQLLHLPRCSCKTAWLASDLQGMLTRYNVSVEIIIRNFKVYDLTNDILLICFVQTVLQHVDIAIGIYFVRDYYVPDRLGHFGHHIRHHFCTLSHCCLSQA